MIINILTIFPDFFKSGLNTSILKRAQEKNLIKFNIIDIREFAQDKHRLTDDRPYGGGAGMVMKVEPIHLALESLGRKAGHKILTSAKGNLFTQQKAQDFSELDSLTIICGHYEGVDERVADNLIDEEVRIGDYVLTGGESATQVIVDAVTRLIPGVLGNEDSNQDESHSEPGKFTHPVYTRPEKFKNWKVPEVLLSGDHQKITQWRELQSKKTNS